MENYTDKFAKRVKDLVEQSAEPIKTVECIDDYYSGTTLGKKYPVITISNGGFVYTILDDKDRAEVFHKDFFKDIEEPKKAIIKIPIDAEFNYWLYKNHLEEWNSLWNLSKEYRLETEQTTNK